MQPAEYNLKLSITDDTIVLLSPAGHVIRQASPDSMPDWLLMTTNKCLQDNIYRCQKMQKKLILETHVTTQEIENP